MKRLAITILLSMTMTVNAYAVTAHDQAMSYILSQQDKPTEPGDKLYTVSTNDFPVLLDTTGYCMGTHGSHGDKMRHGYVAYQQDTYGWCMELYEAVEQEDGSFELGEYIGLYEIRDTGFGKESGQGKSRVRSDKDCAGTIETGEAVDVYHTTLAECKEWMQRTKGRVFAVIIPNVKG